MAAAVAQFGRLDVMCNNAGTSGDLGPTADVTSANWDRVMAINARSAFIGCRQAIPAMLRGGGGSIINTASVSGLEVPPIGDGVSVSQGRHEPR